jgi:hypothetical protein
LSQVAFPHAVVPVFEAPLEEDVVPDDDPLPDEEEVPVVPESSPVTPEPESSSATAGSGRSLPPQPMANRAATQRSSFP